MNEPILRFVLVALLVFLINIPFGVLRGKQKRFSFKWFLYIHLPIPLLSCFGYSVMLDFHFTRTRF